MKTTRITLIKTAIDEWKKGLLSDYKAMLIVSTIFSIKKPSKECTEWAKRALLKLESTEGEG